MSDEEGSVYVIVPNPDELLNRITNVNCTHEGCEKSFIHHGALKMHLIKSHGQVKSVSDKRLFHKGKTGDVQVLRFHCPVEKCKYSMGSDRHFPAFHHLRQHYIKVHAERKYKCSKCEMGFGLESDLQKHMIKCGVMYKCGTCPVQYTTKEALCMHCKRTQHLYPEEYQRKMSAEQDKKQQRLAKKVSATVVLSSVLTQQSSTEHPGSVNVPVNDEHCKQTISSNLAMNKEDPHNNKHLASVNAPQQSCQALKPILPKLSDHHEKQSVVIQTDIYGIDELALNKNIHNNLTLTYLEPSGTVQLDTCQKQDKKRHSFKRQGSFKRQSKDYYNPSSPRRKKLKSTTGMQTSVSLTKKKGIATVNSTQTTQDLIQAAMTQANLPVEKKTVGSQVTPHKIAPGKHNAMKSSEMQTSISGFRPQFVDSSSQVIQDFAESETMTDEPPSMATQTLQSFLEKQHITAADINVKSTVHNESSTHCEKRMEVKIYGQNLESHVSYLMPSTNNVSETKTLSSFTQYSEKSHLDKPTRASQLQHVPNFHENINSDKSQAYINVPMSGVPGIAGTSSMSLSRDSTEYMFADNQTIDMEAQTMSASEFDELLQSSGIFLEGQLHTKPAASVVTNKRAVSVNDSFTQNYEMSSTSSVVGSLNEGASRFDILSVGTSMTDMNTQTITDFNLFDDFVPTDSNTQTTDENDILSLMMSNTETQTLNDEDLITLGLLERTMSHHSDIAASTTHNMSIGTSDFDEDLRQVAAQNPSNELSINATSTSEPLDEYHLMSNGISTVFSSSNVGDHSLTRAVNQSSSGDISRFLNPSAPIQLIDPDDKVKVQMETQTATSDLSDSLIQTETQTQVESSDVDFVAINMETQTTFDDLEEFCETLG